MKRILTYAVLIGLVLSPLSVSAAQRAVTLDVPGMTCPVCPITVKKALSGVKGVNEVKVDFDQKAAFVTFDDALTGVDALTRATGNAGFPSSVRVQSGTQQ